MSKTVLVTGAASGIGKAIASALGREGHKVLLSDVDADSLNAAVEELVAEGCRASAVPLDVTSQQDIDRAGDQHAVDVLINNAGMQHVARLEAFDPDKWRLLNNIMLVGPAMLTRAFLPGMKQRNFGRIINVGSIHALVASPYKSAYVAAKHGLLGFSKVVALETAEFDITINTICPSYVKTPLVETQIAAQAEEHGISRDEVINNIMLEPMPKKAFIEFDELVGTVNYLISPSSRNMTGQSVVLDGGWTVK